MTFPLTSRSSRVRGRRPESFRHDNDKWFCSFAGEFETERLGLELKVFQDGKEEEEVTFFFADILC